MGSKYLIDNELNRYKHFKPILSDLMFPFANLYFSLIKKNIDKSLEFSKIRINGYNNKKINLIIYGEKNKHNLPCILYFHGGGFLLKASSHHYKLVSIYAKKHLVK